MGKERETHTQNKKGTVYRSNKKEYNGIYDLTKNKNKTHTK